MLFTGARTATWIPVLPLFGGLALSASLLLPMRPWAAGVLGLAIVGYAIVGTRRLALAGERLVVRGLLRSDEIGKGTAFGYDVRAQGRGAATVFYATDGERTIELWSATAMASARADEVITRLRAAIPTEASAEAREIADAHRREITEREAPVHAYYASPRHRRTMIAIAIGLAVYLAVMAVVTSLE
ncbi:MAG TPA: hypothetical protein VG755_29735 [Nannocystaceae bacterium]|nr:hypothetical protein [Nannocystaceae bacterium]